MSFSLRRWLTPVVCVASRYSNEYKPTFPLIIIIISRKSSKLCDPHLLTPYPSWHKPGFRSRKDQLEITSDYFWTWLIEHAEACSWSRVSVTDLNPKSGFGNGFESMEDLKRSWRPRRLFSRLFYRKTAFPKRFAMYLFTGFTLQQISTCNFFPKRA